MKNIALLASPLALVMSSLAFANNFDQVAHQKAIAAVLAGLKGNGSELGKANASLISPPADGLKSPAQMAAADMGGNEAITLSQMESQSEIDSTVLVRIAYTTGGTPTINDSISAQVKVVLITDPNSGRVDDSQSKAIVSPGSVLINSELK